jgi:TonB family protein
MVEPTRSTFVSIPSDTAGLLQSALVHGGSRRLGGEQRRRQKRSLGMSVALQAGLAGLMLAALALGPPLILPRAAPLKVSVISLPSLTYPLPPRSRPRPRRAALPPPPRPRPAPPRAVPSPAAPPALALRRLEAGVLPSPPPPPADPRPSVAPAVRPKELTPAAAGAPAGLALLPGVPVPAPLLGSFGAVRAAAPGDPPPPARSGAGFAAVAPLASAAPTGVPRSAGFGPATDAPGPAAAAGPIVHPGAFAAPPEPAVTMAAPPPRESGFEPPRVLALPTPAYTAAAAQHRIEGEVVLSVRLGADGLVHILALTRGLGYGLDQSAIAAARRLRFLPARRHGQPIDWTVTLHVQFRLAY